MNKATRMLMMTGMAIVASATFAGPAMAASATPAPSAGQSTTVKASHGDRSKIVGFYRTPGQCHRIGNIGEWRNRWDDHDCFRVRGGFHRNWWALRVSWDNRGHGFPGHGHGFPGNDHGFPGNDHDHGHHGHDFPGKR